MILELEEVGAGAAGAAGGWFDIVIATGDGVLSWQKRMKGKARPFVKDARALLLYSNRPILKVTWMGDTHEETNVLLSNRLNEDSFKEGGHLRQDFSYSRRDSQHKVNPFRQRARQAERMRLDCNAAQQRYSLRLVIQDNTVFILL